MSKKFTPQQQQYIRNIMKCRSRCLRSRYSMEIFGFDREDSRGLHGKSQRFIEICETHERRFEAAMNELQPFVKYDDDRDVWRVQFDHLCDLAFGVSVTPTDNYIHLLEAQGMA